MTNRARPAPTRCTARVVASLVWLIATAAANSAVAALLAGNHPRTLPFGGLTRTYQVHVPASYDGSVVVPLVMDFHGFTSNGGQQAALSGMVQLSDREGFIVAHPDGVNNAWNVGLCCGNAGIDDVGFIRAVVAAIGAEANVDPQRIYATGLSNGGAISQRLACEAADLFAAAARDERSSSRRVTHPG